MPKAALFCINETRSFFYRATAVNLRLPPSALHWHCRCDLFALSCLVCGDWLGYWYPRRKTQGWRR